MTKLREPIRELLSRAPIGDAQLDAIWQRVELRRRPRSLRRALVPALVVCASVAMWFVQRAPQGDPHAPSAALQPLHWSNGAALSQASAVEVGSDALPREVALSDGTRITLGAGSRLVPQRSQVDAIELVLARGEAHFEVAPQGARRFEVQAGALHVRVVGTAFTLRNDEQGANVIVQHGRVRVTTPAAETLLTAGGALHWPELSTAAAVAPAALTGADAARPAQADARKAAWRVVAADGDYAGAYALLGASGYARAVHAEKRVDVLLDLADVARGAGHPRDAALALARVVRSKPADDRIALAALTLGRLQLDALAQPGAATRTLRRALELGLPAALKEDALARLVQAYAQAGDQAQARAMAEQYARHFPGGRYQASVQQWANAP